MKTLLSLLASLTLMLVMAGCNKAKPVAAEPPPPEPTPAPTPAPTPVPTPPPTPKPVVVEKKAPAVVSEPEPPKKVLAPEGTLFAVARITITTDDGIHGVPAGTRLQVVKKTGSGYVVTDGKQEFPVEFKQVTNEIPVAAVAVASPPAASASTASASPSQSSAPQANVDDSAAKERKIRDLKITYDDLVREEAELNARIEQIALDDEREKLGKNKNHSTRTVDAAQRPAWVARIAVIHTEKARVQNELRAVR